MTPKPPPHRHLKLKPVCEQVIVITGASSGIGLSTARAAAGRGARLVLAARNAEALKSIAEDLSHKGAKVVWVEADVGHEAEVRAIAARAVEAFGGFDTWINNAGVTIFGMITDTPIEDQRRLFDTNYWGMVYGSLVAVDHFKTREGGGALINIGSVLGDMAVPQRGTYCASKHAIKAFTNTLRMEMMEQHAPVSVTLVKPSAVDTPYRDHAKNFTGAPVRETSPVYATPLVAQAILYAAEHRARELTVGAGGRFLSLLGLLAPLAAEPLLAWSIPRLSRDEGRVRRGGGDNLHQAGVDLRERSFSNHVHETSLYTSAQMQPQATFTLAVLAGMAAAVAFSLGGGRRKAPAAAASPAPPLRRRGRRRLA